MAPNGLSSSMWASAGHPDRHRYDLRSRSVPAASDQQNRPPMAALPQPAYYHALPSTTTYQHPPAPRAYQQSLPPTAYPHAAAAAAGARAPAISPALAFHRFEQACQRLRWKYIDLGNSYKRALSPEAWAFSVQDAERSFKVDFYEFYAWIEKTLVLALLVFGVVVSRDRQPGLPGDGARGAWSSQALSQHSYHHNVLRALDEVNNPLHGPLGTGDVNRALWKAKELRNRWKDADQGRDTPPLKMYDLTWIVATVLGGLEVAYSMAHARVEEIKGAGNAVDIAMEINESSDAWEWMVEMDWEFSTSSSP